MSASVRYERVRDHLERLKVDHALTALDTVLEREQKEERLPRSVGSWQVPHRHRPRAHGHRTRAPRLFPFAARLRDPLARGT